MGNFPSADGTVQTVPLMCPPPFVSVDAFTCVMPCPSDRQFTRQGSAGTFQCVYTPDPQHRVNLTTVGAVVFGGASLGQLLSVNPQKHAEFVAEQTRFNNELETVYANISTAQKIADAFRALQAAENARDTAPEAYHIARTTYYTLLNGESWVEEERERIAKVEVDPEIETYRDTLARTQQQRNDQQKTFDVVQGVRDKVLSLRDDFKYSVDLLGGQVEKVKSQIAMQNRTREQPKEVFWAWLDTVINIVILAALVYLVWMLYKKFRPAAPDAFPQPALTVSP